MSKLSEEEFNDVVSFKNTDAFLTSVDNMLAIIGDMIKDDNPDDSLEHLEKFLDDESTHLVDLSDKIINWKAELPVAIDAMAELLVIERLSRDLNDASGLVSHYPEIKDTIANTQAQLIKNDASHGAFFNDLCLTLNKHLDNDHDYLGHKWKDFHLEQLSQGDTFEAEEVVVRNPSERISTLGKNSLDQLDIEAGHIEPQNQTIEPG